MLFAGRFFSVAATTYRVNRRSARLPRLHRLTAGQIKCFSVAKFYFNVSKGSFYQNGETKVRFN